MDNLKQDLVSELRNKKKKIKRLKDNLESQRKCYTYLEELEINPEKSELKECIKSLLKKIRLEINNFKKENDISDLEKFKKNLFNRIEEIEQQVNNYKVQLDNLNIEQVGDLKEEYEISQRKVNIYETRSENLEDVISELEDIFDLLENLDNSNRLKEIKTSIKAKDKRLSLLNKQVDQLKKLDRKVPKVINDMTETILNPYKELANRIYQRINPQPIFNKIDWDRNSTSHNNGTLVLKMLSEEGLEVNPSYVYSSAQVNIVVLSLFFSFVIQNNWSKLYSFLKKKFRNLNVLVLEFKSYDKGGPLILRR